MSLPGFVTEVVEDGGSSPRGICTSPQRSGHLSNAVRQEPSIQDLEEQPKEEEKAPKRAFTAPWSIRIGGSILALAAGIVNGVALFALSTFVSHHTGTLSKVALGMEDGEQFSARDSVILLSSFIFGSSISGVIVGRGSLWSGPKFYDVALLIIAGILVATICFDDTKLGSFLAAAACGLQNGLTTIWGGGTCRTTHVTGICTDVGLLLGRIGLLLVTRNCGGSLDIAIRVDLADDLAKLSLLCTLGFAFFSGIYLGAHLHGAVGKDALVVPIVVYTLAALGILAYRAILLAETQKEPPAEEACVPKNMDSVLPMNSGQDEQTWASHLIVLESPRSNVAELGDLRYQACVHLGPGSPVRSRSLNKLSPRCLANPEDLESGGLDPQRERALTHER